jgi:hypothetical protein
MNNIFKTPFVVMALQHDYLNFVCPECSAEVDVCVGMDRGGVSILRFICTAEACKQPETFLKVKNMDVEPAWRKRPFGRRFKKPKRTTSS